MAGYDPNQDFFALLRPSTASQLVRRMPILDLVIRTLADADFITLYIGYTAPTANQNTTAWLIPQNPSWAGPGVMMLWDQTQNSGNGAYMAATPKLFVEFLNDVGRLVSEGTGSPQPYVGVPGSIYLQTDTGQIYYQNPQGQWIVFQTAIANIGQYVTGHGGPGDPLDVNLSTLEPKLAQDLTGKVAVVAQSPITGNGTTVNPLGLDYTATVAGLISNGGLNQHVAVAVDGSTITGAGIAGSPLTVNTAGLRGRIAVITDGVTITGDGTAANPLVAHATISGLAVTSPIIGAGIASNPLGIDQTANAAGLVANGGLNRNVQVAVDGTTITGAGTSGNPLVAHATNTGGPGGTVWASGVIAFAATGAVYPGFPGGVPSGALVTPGKTNNCTITFNNTDGSSFPIIATITFSVPPPDLNYLYHQTLLGTVNNAALPNYIIISPGTFTPNSFQVQMQIIGNAGLAGGALYYFEIIR